MTTKEMDSRCVPNAGKTWDLLHNTVLKVEYTLTCKQFCITHFKEMITKTGGRSFMKRIGRYCRQCTVWFLRKFWLSLYCPCCHKKMHDELKNPIIPVEVRKTEYLRKWRLENRDKWNAYKRDWYKQRNSESRLPST